MSGLLPTPEPDIFIPPQYAPGVKIETFRETETHDVMVEVGLTVGRVVRVSEETFALHRDTGVVMQSTIEQAVRMMQDEAVSALGLQHWRTEVEREVKAKADAELMDLLRSLYAAVRNAPSLAAAQLILADEIEVHR